ncbi:MAG: hypothetical protein ACPMAQ_17495 [Phycisphaerae bacterium]
MNAVGRLPRVAITDKTGTDGIACWVNESPGTKGAPDGAKLTQVFKNQKRIMEPCNEHGWLTPTGDEEPEERIRVHLPELYAKRSLPAQSADV